MAKMIQVRNVPERLHRELLRRARREGKTLTGYIEEILRREMSRPPVDELLERIATREPVNMGASVAKIIKRERPREAS